MANTRKSTSTDIKPKSEEMNQNQAIAEVLDQSEIINKLEKELSELKLQSTIAQGVKSTVDSTFAYIEFDPTGVIQDANNNFITALGYSELKDIQGEHHRMFCEKEYASSAEYKEFWNELAAGKTKEGQFKRVCKDGSEIWIQAAYTPLLDDQGTVLKVVKIASDVTEDVLLKLNAQGIRETVDSSFAYIEFDPKGNIQDANNNFITALGFSNEKEIHGKHHRIFCDQEYANSFEYKQFWQDLGEGKTQEGQFKRICKDGSEVWIQAAYTPLKDSKGNVFKVIKIASDITADVLAKLKAEGIKETVDTSFAFIEFDPKGNIQEANRNFVAALQYTGESEIIGKHHSIFCEVSYVKSADYKNFWEDLANGISKNGVFKRISKVGTDVWIQATYTPIKDSEGNVVKVIKIASDITTEVENQNNVITEVNRVVALAAEEGDFDARLNLPNVEGDWKTLVESINTLIDSVARPLGDIKELITELSSGNLNQTFEFNGKGFISELADSYNVAIDNLNGLMTGVAQVSELIATSSEELLTKSDQMQGTTQEVASAIQQMAEGAHQQASQTDEASKLVEDVMKSSEDMALKADRINSAAENGQKSSEDGANAVALVVENMSGIQQAANDTSSSIDVLSERSEKIARTLNVITDIASQTNLLALNAAIEAARAGEAGRGFAVVAEEIRKLAEDSRKSAIDIEQVIVDVQKDIGQASKAITSMENSVTSGGKASKAVEEVFVSIEKSNTETLSLSEEIVSSTGEQKLSIGDTVKNIEKIVVVSEETAAGSEQIATSSKELSEGMDEVASTSKSLAEVAEQLQNNMSKFQLKS